jgi:cytidylate kinase
MTVITISRQFGSSGDEIARRVCELLGFQIFDKRLIARAASESGIAQDNTLLDYTEENYQVRSFLDRLFNRMPAVSPMYFGQVDIPVKVNDETRINEDVAVELVETAIHSAYNAGNMVIVGRGGQMILQDKSDAIHVRVEAPLEDRIQRVKEHLRTTMQVFRADIDIRRKAQDLIYEKDAASASYIRHFYHRDWDDLSLYHLVINSGKLSIEDAARLVACLVK